MQSPSRSSSPNSLLFSCSASGFSFSRRAAIPPRRFQPGTRIARNNAKASLCTGIPRIMDKRMELEKQKESAARFPGLDAYRIVCMLMVVTGHVLLYTGMLESRGYGTTLLHSFCLPAVPMFVILSGFLLCEKPFSVSRILTLWLQVLVLAKGLDVAQGLICGDWSRLAAGSGYLWFWRTYLALALFTPVLNAGVRHADKTELTFSLCVLTVLFPSSLSVHGVLRGRSVAGFVLLYCWGAWAKTRLPPAKRKGLRFLLAGLALFAAANARWFLRGDGTGVVPASFWFQNASPAIVLFSVVAVDGFAALRAGAKSGWRRILARFGEAAFPVYVISEHPLAKAFVFGRCLKGLACLSSPWSDLAAVLAALGLFLVCSALWFAVSAIVPFKKIRRWFSGIERNVLFSKNAENSV